MPIKNPISERYSFQRYFIDYLTDRNQQRDVKSRYIERFYVQGHYDEQRAMDTELTLKFVKETQPAMYERFVRLNSHLKDPDNLLISSIREQIIQRKGTLIQTLRMGIDLGSNVHFTLMYPKPATKLNPEAVERYERNIFSIMEEVIHKDGERVDLVVFINGFAIIAFELKSNTSGQSYRDAMDDFKIKRDPNSPLFKWQKGTIVNFAMDLEQVFMTTKMERSQTYFIPFNKGTLIDPETGETAAGNSPNPDDYPVSYMWNDILQKDTLMDLLTKYIFIERSKKHEEGKRPVIKETIIFPRFHQLNCIRKILIDINVNKTDKNYLIQHSAGSGKTKTIAWLAHRLANFSSSDNSPVYDQILVITDRIVVDRQLQDAILQVPHLRGQVKILDDNTKFGDLIEALEGNTKVIVCTTQKFLYTYEKIDNMSNKNFAVIIDEAHSSTGGKMLAAVSASLSKDYEPELDEEGQEVDSIDLIMKDIDSYKKQKNISFFAFTATPKPTTLKRFGRKNKFGKEIAFDIYSMRQAIQEGFILNVLENYMTIKTYFDLIKTVNDDPEFESKVAKRKIAEFVNLHDTNLTEKTKIIVEHFRNTVLGSCLDGKEKAMIVTSGREQAVAYYHKFNEYLARNHYDDISTLVAFSGALPKSSRYPEVTEESINGIAQDKLREEFDKDDYQVLLVANKYQTGFDQPKLCAMYVDKKLYGVTAVQTLSRLNRSIVGKNKKTFVIDFKNTYEEIHKAFKPFYTYTELGNTIQPNDVYDKEQKLELYGFLDFDDVHSFNNHLYKKPQSQHDKARIIYYLQRAKDKIMSRCNDEQLDIQDDINAFIRLYVFVVSVTALRDSKLHELYNFLELLIRELDIHGSGNSVDITGKVDIQNFRTEITHKPSDNKEVESDPVVKLPNSDIPERTNPEKQKLSKIIDEINQMNGTNIDSEIIDRNIQQTMDVARKDYFEAAMNPNNSLRDFKFAFFEAIKDALSEVYTQNNDFSGAMLEHEDWMEEVFGLFVEEELKNLRENKGRRSLSSIRFNFQDAKKYDDWQQRDRKLYELLAELEQTYSVPSRIPTEEESTRPEVQLYREIRLELK